MGYNVRPWVLHFGRGCLLVGHLEKILACTFFVVVCTFFWFESCPVCQCGDIYCIPSDNTNCGIIGPVVFSGAPVAGPGVYFMSPADTLRGGGVRYD